MTDSITMGKTLISNVNAVKYVSGPGQPIKATTMPTQEALPASPPIESE